MMFGMRWIETHLISLYGQTTWTKTRHDHPTNRLTSTCTHMMISMFKGNDRQLQFSSLFVNWHLTSIYGANCKDLKNLEHDKYDVPIANYQLPSNKSFFWDCNVYIIYVCVLYTEDSLYTYGYHICMYTLIITHLFILIPWI